MFLNQNFIIQFQALLQKTFLFLVNSSFFYNTLKFEKFPPSRFMAAHWRRLALAVNDIILNFSKKQKFKTVYVLCWMLSTSKLKNYHDNVFVTSYAVLIWHWRHLQLFPVSLVTRSWTKMVETLSNFKVIWNKP